MYAEVSVIVEGALEKEETFFDYALLDDYVGKIEEEVKGDGYYTEVFILYHEHDPLEGDEECQCVQYVTDHHPAYSWNC